MDEEVQYSTWALEQCQREAERALKTLERVNFYLGDNPPDEVHELLEDIFKSLTRMTWL